MGNDEITRAFQDITPEHFWRESSACAEVVYVNPLRGAEAYAEFSTAMDLAALDHHADPRRAGPQAVLHSPTRQRTFLPDADETIRHFIDRLKREARAMDAIWFHVTMVSPAEVAPASKTPGYDPYDPDSIQQALQRGELSYHLVSFIASREGGRPSSCTLWPLVDGGGLGSATTGRGDDSPLFMEVLDF